MIATIDGVQDESPIFGVPTSLRVDEAEMAMVLRRGRRNAGSWIHFPGRIGGQRSMNTALYNTIRPLGFCRAILEAVSAVSARETFQGYSRRKDCWFIAANWSEYETKIRFGATATTKGCRKSA